MSVQPDEHDPDATVWQTVAALERKGFTKAEIVTAMTQTAQELVNQQDQ